MGAEQLSAPAVPSMIRQDVKPPIHRQKQDGFSDKNPQQLPNKCCVPGNTAWQRETGTIKTAH